MLTLKQNDASTSPVHLDLPAECLYRRNSLQTTRRSAVLKRPEGRRTPPAYCRKLLLITAKAKEISLYRRYFSSKRFF
jgi:hypothetical protein